MPSATSPGDSPVVAELAAAYWRYARDYYAKDGRLTGHSHRIKSALRVLRELYGRSTAADFGPLGLQAIQQRLIDERLARTTSTL